jgi:hypothetical protein
MNPQPSTLNPQPVRARAHQRTLPILPAAFRPMSTLEAARRDITAAGFEYDDSDLEADLDEGRFEWAWNIGTTNTYRRELRIFTPCLDAHIARMRNPRTPRHEFAPCAIYSALFPARGARPYVTSNQVAMAFCCSPELVIYLIDEGSLTQLAGTAYRRGNGGAAVIAWPAITTFLNTRRI